LSKPGHEKRSRISLTTVRDKFPAAVIFNPGPAAADCRRIRVLRATADCWSSWFVRSAASRIDPDFGDGGLRNAMKLL
jgi:hypothetical protein